MLDIKIIHEPTEREPFVVLDKPSGLPSAPLQKGDDCAYERASKIFPELNCVIGKKNIEHGLVHRIDTATRGILVIASTQSFYDYMLQIQEQGLFVKQYLATCDFMPTYAELTEGFPKRPEYSFSNNILDCTVTSKFRPFGQKNKLVRPVTNFCGKAAHKKASSTQYSTNICLQKEDNTYKAICTLTKGYRHQVRCHLAWLGFPIVGDKLYNPNATEQEPFLFKAFACSFIDPVTNKMYKFSIEAGFKSLI